MDHKFSTIKEENNEDEKKVEGKKKHTNLVDIRPLIHKILGDGARFIRRKEFAVIYD